MRRFVHTIWASSPRWLRRLFVRWRESHFIVSVAAAVINDDDEILLCDHVFRRGASWGMPGGFLKNREHPEDGLRRELREELGVRLRNLSVALVRTFPETRQIEIIYRCSIENEPEVGTVELRDWAWFAIDDLPDLTDDQRGLIETVTKRKEER